MGQSFRRKRRWGQIEIELSQPDFLETREESTRRWLMHRFLSEAVADLEALDDVKDGFVRGSQRPLIGQTDWSTAAAEFDTEELVIAGQQVMQEWERPLMEAMVDIATAHHGDILEVGFGMGISAELIQQRGVRSHTIIEANADVLLRAQDWRAARPHSDVRLIDGRWQERAAGLGPFDSVFYDTYPASDEELARLTQTPFSSDFFPVAAELLRAGGVFTYYSNEVDSLSRWHQRRLLDHFDRFSVSVIRGLRPPDDCHYWWAPTMAVVTAFR